MGVRAVLVACGLVGATAAVAAPEDVEPETVIVVADPFARWDGTRWVLEAQMAYPLPYRLYARQNAMMEMVAITVQMVVSCEKTWRRGGQRFEVLCAVEDIAFEAASWVREPHGQEILDAYDTLLTGAALQLVVDADGAIANIDLVGLEEDNDREKVVMEQVRQVLVRVMAAMHLRLPAQHLAVGSQWVEENVPLFDLPVKEVARKWMDTRLPVVENSRGASRVIHQLDRYKGVLVVQDVGEGITTFGEEQQASSFSQRLAGVSIYDDGGILRERVWALHGRATASSLLAEGRASPTVFHLGRFRMLGATERVALRETRMVEPPGRVGELPPWTPIETP